MSRKVLIAGILIFVFAAIGFAVNYDIQKVIIVPVPESELQVSIWLDKDPGAVYKKGEEVKVYFKVNKDAYVAIYDIMPDGSIQLIFPNRYDASNYLKAGKVYSLPTEKASKVYRLIVSGDPGKEIFQIVASTSPLTFIEDMVKRFSKEIFPKSRFKAEKFVEELVRPFISETEYAVNSTFFYVERGPDIGTLKVSTYPLSASVYIDGTYFGKTPLNAQVEEGAHVVSVYKPGYKMNTVKVNVYSGRTTNVSLKLIPDRKTYSLSLSTVPAGARIYLDGTYVGNSPITLSVSKGAHSLRIEKEGYQTYIETIQISGNTSKRIVLNELARKYNLTVKSSPSGASLYIDGAYVGQTPITLNLESGRHKILLRAEGYEDYTDTIYLYSNKTVNISLVAKNAYLKVKSDPGDASVYIDGVYVGQTPLSLTLLSGKHSVKIIKEGYLTVEKEIVLSAGEKSKLNVTLQPEAARVYIETNPAGARIFVDGYDLGYSNKWLTLEPGYHEILLVKEGYHFVYLIKYFERRVYTLSFDLYPIE